MAVVSPPPRFDGLSEEAQRKTLSDYLFRLVNELNEGGIFIKADDQASGGDFDPSQIVDPASATLASAQSTANAAYTLASTASVSAQRVIEAGSITITHPATSAVFAFTAEEEEADADYFVQATKIDKTGTLASGSDEIDTVARTTAGLTLNTKAAPGVGNDVTFHILAMRN